jgi:hypothetical protein
MEDNRLKAGTVSQRDRRSAVSKMLSAPLLAWSTSDLQTDALVMIDKSFSIFVLFILDEDGRSALRVGRTSHVY